MAAEACRIDLLDRDGQWVSTPKNGPLVLNEGVDRLRFKRLAKNLYINGFDGIEVRRCSAPSTL
jgi:hypothetical protein